MSTRDALRAERRARVADDAARAERMGRLSARARIATLTDPGSFRELFEWVPPWPTADAGTAGEIDAGDGIIVGTAAMGGRAVVVVAHDAACRRGAIGRAGADKAVHVLDIAASRGLPVIFLADSDGARVHEGAVGIVGNANLLAKIASLSGRVPLLSATLGLSGGAAGYGAALCDITAAIEDRSFLFITGPQVISAVTGEQTNLEEIGGASMHATKTGMVAATFADEPALLAWLARVLGYLPDAAWAAGPTRLPAPPARDAESLAAVIPDAMRRPYDVHAVIEAVVDGESFCELSARHAKNLVTGFARIDGRSIGVLANQPAHLGGVLDVGASVKAARFVRLCAAFGLPIVTFVDCPGFLPGVKQEQGGLLVHGAKLVSAYQEASAFVPRIAIVLRQSCGAANVMNHGADTVLALPNARIQAMGVDALMTVAWGTHLGELDADARREELAELAELHDDPLAGAQAGAVHRVVEASALRVEVAAALDVAMPPRLAPLGGRKLTNIPL